MNHSEQMEKENHFLKKENQELLKQSRNKDNLINKLEEKISYMEKYITEIEEENKKKNELFANISNTKNELDKLKLLWLERYIQLGKKFEMLKIKDTNYYNNYLPQSDIQKIDNCINNINTVSI